MVRTAVLCTMLVGVGISFAGDATWTMQGEFLELVGEARDTAAFRVGDRRVEVPVAGLTDASRSAVQAAAAAEAGATAQAEEPAAPATSPAASLLDAVESDARRCVTAGDAVNLYRMVVAQAEDLAIDRAAAEERLAVWRDRAAAGKVRWGDEWVDAATAREAAREAEELVRQAVELSRLGNLRLAREKVDAVAEVGRGSLQAKFFLALLPLLQKPVELEIAGDRFADLAADHPDVGAVWFNLAMCELLTRRPAPALSHYRMAVNHLSNVQPLSDVVGLIVANANKRGFPDFKMIQRLEDEYSSLYRQLTQDLGVKTAAGKKEYVFLGLGENSSTIAAMTPPVLASMSAVVGTVYRPLMEGPGIVVAPGKVLVPQTLVDAGDKIIIRDPLNPDALLPGKVIASSPTPPMALVAAEGLKAAPVPITARSPAVGDRVAVVGSAPSSFRRREPDVAAGTMRALADATDSTSIHDAATSCDRGGGAVVGSDGGLVGIVAPTPRVEKSDVAGGLVWPVESLQPFLEKHASPSTVTAGDDVDPEARAMASTVMVVVTSGTMKLAGR